MLCDRQRQGRNDLARRCDALERFDFKSCHLAHDRYGFLRMKQIAPEYFDQRGSFYKGIHRQEDRHALWTLSAPGIGAIPVAALEEFEELGKIREQFCDLQFVEGPHKAEIPAAAHEIFAEVLVELCLESETFRILVIDFLAAIVNVSLIRAS